MQYLSKYLLKESLFSYINFRKIFRVSCIMYLWLLNHNIGFKIIFTIKHLQFQKSFYIIADKVMIIFRKLLIRYKKFLGRFFQNLWQQLKLWFYFFSKNLTHILFSESDLKKKYLRLSNFVLVTVNRKKQLSFITVLIN